MINELIEALKTDGSLILVMVEILMGTIMAFVAVLNFSRSRRISAILFTITAILLYVGMSFRILDELNIFSISQILLFDLPVYKTLINCSPYITITVALIIFSREP